MTAIFFINLQWVSVRKNRRYRSSINISLYIFKNIKIYFKIILEIYLFLFLQLNMFLFFCYFFFVLESGAEAGKGIYPERKENINIFPKK